MDLSSLSKTESTRPTQPATPLASEPRHLLVVLNTTRRKELFDLITKITKHMQENLELTEHPFKQPCAHDDVPLFAKRPSSSSTKTTEMTSASVVSGPVSPDLIKLRLAARNDIKHWANSLLSKLRSLLSVSDDKTILEARRKRNDKLIQPFYPTNMAVLSIDPFNSLSVQENAIIRTKNKYQPINTRLSTISQRDKEEILSALLLQVLLEGDYSAYDRVLLCHVCASLDLPISVLAREEAAVAETLVGSQAKMNADVVEQTKKREEAKSGRYWKVGLASVAGAAVIGITGGLAAPVVAGAIGGIMGGIGMGGVASFLCIFWMNGALVGTLFGAYGAKLGGEAVYAYTKDIEDFEFLCVNTDSNNQETIASEGTASTEAKFIERPRPRLRLTVGINGLITGNDDIASPFNIISPETEIHALQYEPKTLIILGKMLKSLVSTAAWQAIRGEILRRTVLVSLSAALWPVWMIGSAASQLDNPFARARNRSDKTGSALSDALAARIQGRRPVTLIGISLGARVVAQCLKELADKRLFDVVEDVILIGSPIPSDDAFWATMRTVVSGKLVNVFSSQDMVLAFLYRASSIQFGVAGLQSIDGVPGVENVDLSEEFDSHLKYPGQLNKILTRCGLEGIASGFGEIQRNESKDISAESEVNLMNIDGTTLGNWEEEMNRATKNIETLKFNSGKQSPVIPVPQINMKIMESTLSLQDNCDLWEKSSSKPMKEITPLRPTISGPSKTAPAALEIETAMKTTSQPTRNFHVQKPTELSSPFISLHDPFSDIPQPLKQSQSERPSIFPKVATDIYDDSDD